LERVLYRGFRSQRGILRLGELAELGRGGSSAWALTQEKARLEYLAAKEAYEKTPTWRAFRLAMEHLIQLHSTNAVVGSLLNEYLLEQLAARSPQTGQSDETAASRRCA
jgi:hypothetical protein